ncbi:MAG TPA: tripartite tricarboxylate transporter substrate binding protein [Xanthobacteraceae bacterium]|jgi:tripartite-type tricarboxylate transporter receptor subunit TctC|nr:tripartite tricarboxylate transporter substrate binding protein [Xanthobacteraceae bacterium]
MRRFGRTVVYAFWLVLVAAQAPAQTYPSKPVRIIVPYAPGGLTDVVARLYSEQLRQSFGRGVFVENKPGASGIIAIEEMARARPDGHTLMIGNISTNALTPVVLAKKMKIDYEQDVQIVTPLADVPVFFLATTTNFSPTTFADFLAYAREHPGKVRYGSAGVGSYQQINTEILAKRAGLDLVHIPFKGGGAEILRDLANGDIHVSWFNITNPVGMMKAGRVRALAIAAEQRLSQHADVPTLAEVGFPGMRAAQWVAAFAPSAVPADIIETLRKAFVTAMSVPEMQAAFTRGGMLVPRQTALEDAKGWLKAEMASWKRDVEDTGIVVED